MQCQRKGTVTSEDNANEIYVVDLAGNEVKQQLNLESSNTQTTALEYVNISCA